MINRTNISRTDEVTHIAPDELRSGMPAPLNEPPHNESGSPFSGDVFEMLKSDHDRISTLFAEIMGATDPEDIDQSFTELYKVVMMHTQAEEASFYPTLSKLPDAQSWIDSNIEGHQDAKQLLEDIQLVGPSSKGGQQTIRELQSLLENHVREEEDYVFNAARTDLKDTQLQALTQEVRRERIRFAQELELDL